MCGEQNVRTTTRDNTGQNREKKTHPIPEYKLKFLTLPGIEPYRRAGRQGFYRLRYGDGIIYFSFRNFTFIIKARRAGSDGSMSASGSAGPGFDPRRGSKFLFENF